MIDETNRLFYTHSKKIKDSMYSLKKDYLYKLYRYDEIAYRRFAGEISAILRFCKNL
jgi:hypothetical protein